MGNANFSEFSTVKYEISATFEIQGVVEKSDVVGAIFGQTEGLLGEELDIRDLQKSGRIGRINVDMESKDGITNGTIIIPSSLGRVETAIMAATIETVDRVGPCNASFTLQKLDDVRKTKRDRIIDRATELLQTWELEVSPESQEITDAVLSSRLSEDITIYGEENLPAGPDVESSDTIIVCEGRADVLNLLTIGVKNTIATNGTKVPRTVAELSKKKTTIAFLDGDRGGDMILNELLQVGQIDWVARAPDGKEVEDLTKKELLKALQAKVPVTEEFIDTASFSTAKKQEPRQTPRHVETQPNNRKKARGKNEGRKKGYEKQKRDDRGRRPDRRGESSYRRPAEDRKPKSKPTDDPTNVPGQLREESKKLLGTTTAILFDEKLEKISEVPTAKIVEELQKENGQKIKHVVFDGIISQRLLDISAKEGIDTVIGTRVGNVKKPAGVKVYCIDQFTA